MSTMYLIVILLLSMDQSGAIPFQATPVVEAPVNYFPYDLSEPDHVISLPKPLKEISGLTYDEKNELIIAVQDEDGKVFFVDPKSGKINREVTFWKDGDYEGIEVVGDEVYVIKSSGTLYRVTSIGTEQQDVLKYNEFLTGDHDVEGLGYDPANNRLLVACKNTIYIDGKQKGLYSFNLDKKVMSTKPALVISKERVRAYLKTNPNIRKLDDMKEFFKEKHFDFSPSAVAIHPKTGNFYITSSVNKKILIVFSPEGKVLRVEKLKKSIHPQPEGICFDGKNNLYISNEGKDGPGVIYKFKPRL